MDAKRKILVIENDQAVCDMIARALKNRGYEVFSETHYKEGIEKAGEVLPDLVFISLLLDTTNGLKASKEIHAMERLRKVPVVMLISYKGELDPKYTITIGIVDVLVKPLSETAIVEKTEGILGPRDTEGAEEEIVPEISDIEERKKAPEEEEALVFDISEGSEQEILELEEAYPESPGMVEDEQGRLSGHIHEAKGDTSALEDHTEEPGKESMVAGSTGWGDDKKEDAEEDLTAAAVEKQGKAEDLAMPGEKDSSGADDAKKGSRKKRLVVEAALAALAFIAVIGMGTYFGLQFFSADKGKNLAPSSVRQAPVSHKPDAQATKAETLPETTDLKAKAKEAAAVTAEQSGKKEEVPPRAPVLTEKGKGSSAVRPEQSGKKEEVPSLPPAPAEKGKGTAAKSVSPVKQAEVPEVRKKGAFSVQVGFFGKLKNAEAMAALMKEKGYEAFVKKEEKSNGKTSYRVLVGKFDTSDKALELSAGMLRKEGIKSVPYRE